MTPMLHLQLLNFLLALLPKSQRKALHNREPHLPLIILRIFMRERLLNYKKQSRLIHRQHISLIMTRPELRDHIIHDRRIKQLDQLVLKYDIHDLLPFISCVQQHDLHVPFILQSVQEFLDHGDQGVFDFFSFAYSELKRLIYASEELNSDHCCLERVVRVDE